MPDLVDHVGYLSQGIGPRPAGTEEEQQAALYIADQLQQEAGLRATVEDFESMQSDVTARVICCATSLVVAFASTFFPTLSVVAVIVSLITALLFLSEELGKPILSRASSRGVSQNIVARYDPGYSPDGNSSRRRKIVLVTRYDSGKVRPQFSGALLKVMPAYQWGCLVSMCALPFVLLIRNVIMSGAQGAALVVLNVLVVLFLICPIALIVLALMDRMGNYNEGANCNASGVAALIEVARRVNMSAAYDYVEEADVDGQGAVVHGEAAAWASGLVPEGAQLVYEASKVKPPERAPQTAEERLASAKAAIAALTGKPVSGSAYVTPKDVADKLVQVGGWSWAGLSEEEKQARREAAREALESMSPDDREEVLSQAEAAAKASVEDAASEDEAQEAAEAAYVETIDAFVAGVSPAEKKEGEEEAPSGTAVTTAKVAIPSEYVAKPEEDDSVPAWYKAAQEKAKKPAEDKPVARSRYADALDAAVTESSEYFAEANTIVETKLEESLRSGREEIREVKAPSWAIPREGDAAKRGAQAAEASASSSQDGSTFAVDAAPAGEELPLPSFLDEHAVQEAARAEAAERPRSSNRVDVTDVAVGAGGLSSEGAPASLDQPLPANARRVELPRVVGTASSSTAPAVPQVVKQRAPLAEAQTSSSAAAKSLLTMLPTIQVAGDAEESASGSLGENPAAVSDARSSLRASLPSLSGSLRTVTSSPSSTGSVSPVGSFQAAGATGAFAPVGDELLEGVAPEEIYVDDADDSVFAGGVTQTGAFAGPGYVEMPKTRKERFFGRFRGGKKKGADTRADEQTPQEWLQVDSSFDPRVVGAERGGWESFQSGAGAYYGYDQQGGYGAPSGYGDQQGGYVGGYDSYDGYGGYGASYDTAFEDVESEFGYDDFDGGRRWQGGAYSIDYEDQLDEELDQVQGFRAGIDTEVWFVALGAELAKNSGMRAFLNEHTQDLKGAIVVDIEALGAGELCLIEREGCYRPVRTSSRMGRLVRKAGQANGMRVGSARICWEESAATVAAKRGFQVMHLVGMANGKPALYAESGDIIENLDFGKLNDNIDFVVELLRNI